MSIDLSASQKKQLVRILKQISLGCDLEALAVVNAEGIKVAFFSEKGTDPDLLSAVSSAILSTGKMVSNNLAHGDLEQVLIRGEEGFTILASADEYILIGASRDLHNVGLAMQVIKRYVPDAIEILAEA
ncbi:MAG: roadblock/LC7 domain-containing protein [Candidatus Heimdallarchaeota archaeon]|nr:roadblock/LC7 domain-containing protein [Candidatus Heimdallarchaeota archaeon]MCK5142725.1 roadblock/LC7 domain-containing protein [Candidatus Heimdallarchaeota archaeon]